MNKTMRRPSRIVIAPDSFKGSVTAREAAQAIAEGWRELRPKDDVVTLPMADGGEGTLATFAAAYPAATWMPVTVEGPAGTPIAAEWLLLPAEAGVAVGAGFAGAGSAGVSSAGGETHPGRERNAGGSIGVIELARSSGIELLQGSELRPLDASSFGFGETICAALEHGVSALILAIGGSACSDGGAGMLEALGAKLYDAAHRPLPRGARGLALLQHVDLTALRAMPSGGVTVLSDVDAPLCGKEGAAYVFAPQKGARPEQLAMIDAALAAWAEQLPGDPAAPGAGAAGGVGFALASWGARRVRGAEEIARILGLADALSGASLLITGEGSFDSQSMLGKAPAVALTAARAAGVPSAVVAGRILHEAAGLLAAVSLCELAGGAEAAIQEAPRWLREAGRMLAECYSHQGRSPNA